jgi:hypothetical protein
MAIELLSTLKHLKAAKKVKLSCYMPQRCYGRREGIAATLSEPSHYTGVSSQHHTPAVLYPQGMDPDTHWKGEPHSWSECRGYRKNKDCQCLDLINLIKNKCLYDIFRHVL